MANPAVLAAQARAAQAASNAALKQGLTGARAGTSVLPLSAKAAAGTVAAGIATLGGGLVLGNTIYEGIGRPFGPSLGDHVRSQIADGIGQQQQSNAESRPTDIGQQYDPTTYGDSTKRYYVTYQTKTDYGENHSQGPRTFDWRSPKTKGKFTGPIGTGSYSDPNSLPEGKHFFKGVTGSRPEEEGQFGLLTD